MQELERRLRAGEVFIVAQTDRLVKRRDKYRRRNKHEKIKKVEAEITQELKSILFALILMEAKKGVTHVGRSWVVGFSKELDGISYLDARRAIDEMVAEGLLVLEGPNPDTPQWRLGPRPAKTQ